MNRTTGDRSNDDDRRGRHPLVAAHHFRHAAEPGSDLLGFAAAAQFTQLLLLPVKVAPLLRRLHYVRRWGTWVLQCAAALHDLHGRRQHPFIALHLARLDAHPARHLLGRGAAAQLANREGVPQPK